ncbi:MAG TPA: hypothetical protein VNO30_10775 [Kofleriaceae bacterium]|nr:hypothetical protein [Kofleriaceae bacterium]
MRLDEQHQRGELSVLFEEAAPPSTTTAPELDDDAARLMEVQSFTPHLPLRDQHA